MVRVVTVTEATRRLSTLVQQAQRGETVIVTVGGEPVAAIVPVPREADPGAPLGLAAFAGELAGCDGLEHAVATVMDVRGASRDRDLPEIA